jgi:hypothetical protein
VIGADGRHHKTFPRPALTSSTAVPSEPCSTTCSALADDKPLAARAAATVTADIEVVTALYLLRLWHHLETTRRDQIRHLMGRGDRGAGRARPQRAHLTHGRRGRTSARCRPAAGLAADAARRELRLALDFLAGQRAVLDALTIRRAERSWPTTAACARPRATSASTACGPACRWMCWVSTCCCRTHYDVQSGVQICTGE